MDYTKESLYKAYAKHTKMGLDDLHMPGTDSMCAVCDEIKQIDAALETGHTVVKTKEPRKYQRYQSKVFEITEANGVKSYVRITTQKQAAKFLKAQQYKEISPVNYRSVYLINDNGSLLSLNEALAQDPEVSGLIGYKDASSNEKGYARRKLNPLDRYIKYTGNNLETIVNFVKPLKAAKTKKGNKVQVNTPQGNVSLKETDYLVKLPNQRLLHFTGLEFQDLYDVNI
ncbi:hypothetical protein EFO90_06905 [Lactiplantibacillus plantarum]|uniref:hypothetical protein n=1 Tax=Lactiplantibacillus plantarum TaxID=1590 RepID=UPI0021A329B3|nr:hypothetical protein [Lactiplantibacillus plantarum]MCT3214125.1 hypothetical protein [Lactiplantibacillus plantarum]MCT3271735.1 hypothetical protein [Lactiplantibacillus plantarum]